MARIHRRGSTTGIHHVMNRGVDHASVFFGDVDRVEFGRRLADAHADHEVTTLAYCLLDNHFHLLLRAPPDRLSPAMKQLGAVYTQHTNGRLGRDGPLFRGRFHSIPVETDAYLLQAARYVHRNPLDLPGVASPRDYRWSSYRTYLGLRRRPDFLDVEPVTTLLGGPDAVAAFTEDDVVPGWPVESVRDLRAVVEWTIAVDHLEHGGDGDRPRIGRTVMALVADRSGDPALCALVFEGFDDSTARALRRAHQRLRTDPLLRRVVALVEATVGRTCGV